MKFLSQRVVYSTLFYILVIIMIILSKPSMLFDSDGEVKQFGIGEGKTIFSLGVVVVAFSIVSFYIFAIIDIIFGSK